MFPAPAAPPTAASRTDSNWWAIAAVVACNDDATRVSPTPAAVRRLTSAVAEASSSTRPGGRGRELAQDGGQLVELGLDPGRRAQIDVGEQAVRTAQVGHGALAAGPYGPAPGYGDTAQDEADQGGDGGEPTDPSGRDRRRW